MSSTDPHVSRFTFHALPWLAAVLVLLVALVVTWPGAVLGEDQKAEERLPAKRAAVEQARQEFVQAEDAYKSYIDSRNMGAMLQAFKAALPGAQDAPRFVNSPELLAVVGVATDLTQYLAVLAQYAKSGEEYLDTLRLYDDDLMAWTRSLGAPSEGLRDDTFPIVEHLKLYPPPLGLREDPPLVTASQVLEQETRLRAGIEKLRDSSPNRDALREHLATLDAIINDIWESGRSIEHIESLHADYYKFLQTYDEAVGRVAASASGAGQLSFPAIAANAAVGLALLVGMGLLFSARGRPPEA